MNNHVRSVIFIDLDETIMTGPFSSVVFPQLFQAVSDKSGVSVEEVRRQVVKENLDRQENPSVPAVLAMDWDDIISTVATRLGVKLQPNIEDIVRTHAGPPYSAAEADARHVLHELRKPYRAIVVATKGLRKYQLPILDALELTPLFTQILTPDTHHVLKRNIAFYGDWPTKTRLQMHVGDHFQDDVVAPEAFGFKAIWKPSEPDETLAGVDPFARPQVYRYPENSDKRPHAIILSLAELSAVVEQLEAEYLVDD